MARRLTEAAALKQLKTVGDKLAGKVTGKQRLELLRRQAELGDQRDAAAADSQARRRPPTTLPARPHA